MSKSETIGSLTSTWSGRRLRTTSDGVEILGDAPRPAEIERLLEALGAERIEQTLCG